MNKKIMTTSGAIGLPHPQAHTRFELVLDATINNNLIEVDIKETDINNGQIIHWTFARALPSEKRSLNWIGDGNKWVGWPQDKGWNIIQESDGLIKEGVWK